ncbi:trypsin inhibitor ClTI-1-like [Spea bombifrons]|uniref:trypsin inhibitor ClTI-1-like n=1 Tax=Spea bombifrons TaxID=233779 RepID=UPI00234B8CC4|nr:trypsin inhibitor ClTI-1-like [Spea bombifrons]
MGSSLLTVLVFSLIAGAVLTTANVMSPVEPVCSRYTNAPCKDEYKPLCGTDGYNYGSECQLCMENRHRSERVLIKHNGRC